MSATDLDEALLALFLLSDREGVTVDELKRAIEKVREELRAGRASALEDLCGYD